MKKLFYILIPIVIVIAIFVVYKILNKQPQELILNTNQSASTTDSGEITTPSKTKTYRNEEFGFEFQYPTNWVLKESTFKSYYSKFNLVVNPGFERSSNFTISINIVLPEFPERSFSGIDKTTSEITVAGVDGVKYEYEFEGSQETAIILPFSELKMILSTDNKQYSDEFNQILTSFKFLK